MKTKFLKFVSLISTLIILLFWTNTCDITDPRDDFKVIFNLDPIETVISGTIVNAATGEPINTASITVSIEGENKNDIVDLTAKPKTSFTTNEGFVCFALQESVSPTENNPANIIVTAKADGYISNFIPVDIMESGSASFILPLAVKDNLPAGVCVSRKDFQTDNNGATVSSTEITSVETETNVSASITIPEGIKFIDNNGNILTGNLTGEITYYSPKLEEALSCFPGGFNVYTNTNGLREQSTFITAGVAEINIKDAAGKEANTFQVIESLNKKTNNDTTEPLIVIEIPSETYNPETNDYVKEGDEIDLWSMQSESVEWDWENRVSVQYNSSTGKLYVEFQPEHFSSWNFDWKGTFCDIGGTIKFTGFEFPYPLKVVLIGNGGQFRRELRFSDGVITFYNPPNFPVTVLVYDGNTNELLGQKEIDDLCYFGEIYWDLTINPPSPPIELIIYAEGWCTCDTNLVIRPSGNPIWYRNLTLSEPLWIVAGSLENGRVTIPTIFLGHSYAYGTWYQGRWYQISATVYEDRAEINGNLTTSNILEVYFKEGNVLYFKMELSDEICNNLCD
ncbi:MAG: hypothetical protein PVH88_00805 [Ignavibacteria bacterium]|jgi:hypothetical protein